MLSAPIRLIAISFCQSAGVVVLEKPKHVPAGIVDEDIDRSGFCLHSDDRPLHGLVIPDVGSDGYRAAA
jgi:hypothetical protein